LLDLIGVNVKLLRQLYRILLVISAPVSGNMPVSKAKIHLS
jgi:hypothetical protein